MTHSTQAQAAVSPSPFENISGIIRGFWESRALAIAAELELADQLAEGPLGVDVLAERTKTHSPKIGRAHV